MTTATHEVQTEALTRAATGQSFANYEAIFEGFAEKGVPLDEIKPRENVFTFNAWKALGRVVRKGEHGVKVVTWIQSEKTDKQTGEISGFKFAKTTTVFHISQTDALN